MLPHLAGRYYTYPLSTSTMQAIAPAINTLTVVPFLVPTTGSYDRIAVEQTAAGASNYRLGIYGPLVDAVDGLPLIADPGTIAVAGAGAVEAVISVTLAAGWYLLALLTDTARNLRYGAAQGLIQQLGAPDPLNNLPSSYAQAALAFGALPATLPAMTIAVSTVYPLQWLRRA